MPSLNASVVAGSTGHVSHHNTLHGLYNAITNRSAHLPGLGLYFPEAEGAVGDGTTDDSVALQAAINAAQGNGTVVLAGKTYKFGTGLVIDAGETAIVGVTRESSILKYTGTGTGLSSSDGGLQRHWLLQNFTIDTRSAGASAVGMQIADVYTGRFINIRLRCTGSATRKALVLLGATDATDRSTYFNVFDDLEAASDGDVITFSGVANANIFRNGLIGGAGRSVYSDQGNSTNNIGEQLFFGTAFQTTGSTFMELGLASGSTTSVTSFQFIGCRMEAFSAASILLHPNAIKNVFIGGTISSDITFTDNGEQNTIIVPSAGMFKIGTVGHDAIDIPRSDGGVTIGGDTEMYRSAAGVMKFNDQLKTVGAALFGDGSASATQITNGTIRASGSSTNQNESIESKGTGRINLNATGTATGGSLMEGAAGKVGFYGTTPIAKQTGVAADAASIHAALVALGLISA